MVFWPRLEIFLSFVLSELHRFLFVSQNRLEIAEDATGGPRSVFRELTSADLMTADVQF